MILSGTFEQIIALFAVLFLVYYISGFLAVFVLRHREPALARPYRAFGFPITTGIALLGSVALLIAAVVEYPRSGVIGAGFLGVCAIAYVWLARRRAGMGYKDAGGDALHQAGHRDDAIQSCRAFQSAPRSRGAR